MTAPPALLPAAVLALRPAHLAPALFGPAQERRARSLLRIDLGTAVTDFGAADPSALAAAQVLLTGWNPPVIDAAALARMPRLELVVHMGGGHPDGALLEAAGIRVIGLPQVNAAPTAEFAAAMILLAAKQAFRSARLYRREQRFLDRELHFADSGIHAAPVGIIGAGAVGRRVIGLLAGRGMELLVHDPALREDEAAALGVCRASSAEIFARCQVISLHASTDRVLVGREELAALRDGATLVNTARGHLVDQDALVEELATGRIDAILDVTEPDVLPPGHPLFSLPNVHLTPHVAGSMGRELHLLADAALDAVADHLSPHPSLA